MYSAERNTMKIRYNEDLRWARQRWNGLSRIEIAALDKILEQYEFSVLLGDILYLEGKWYVTHMGLLRLANKKRCCGIQVEIIPSCCDFAVGKWVFKATVFKTPKAKGFAGYGDADPSNVSALVQGAEMRVAETRAVNRALRKAYGIGICSVEEIGSLQGRAEPERKPPSRPSNGRSTDKHAGNGNSNGNGIRVRDRLCQLIRQHNLDAAVVKAYAVDFCGTKSLREASREQVENFVSHLAEWAQKDRNALLCQLNSYRPTQAQPEHAAAGAA
jgi:hypothetical protein